MFGGFPRYTIVALGLMGLLENVGTSIVSVVSKSNIVMSWGKHGGLF